MARRSATAEPEVETTEATSTTTEATEAPTSTESVDLSAFKASVDAASAAADSDTGTVPDAEVASVQAEYRNLPSGKDGKNAAKAHLNEAMRSAMNEGNIAKARAFMQLSDSLSAPAPKAAREPKAPADPTEAFVQKVAAVQLAYSLVTSDVPDGVAADWSEKVNAAITEAMPQVEALKAWNADESEDKGDAPESGYVARTALRISSGKVPGVKTGTSTPFTGERRDVGEHIKSAFADLESGAFLTVAEIRSHKSSEYGDAAPSAGAISARLFPTSGKCSVEGITPGQNEKGTRGAFKA